MYPAVQYSFYFYTWDDWDQKFENSNSKWSELLYTQWLNHARSMVAQNFVLPVHVALGFTKKWFPSC